MSIKMILNIFEKYSRSWSRLYFFPISNSDQVYSGFEEIRRLNAFEKNGRKCPAGMGNIEKIIMKNVFESLNGGQKRREEESHFNK